MDTTTLPTLLDLKKIEAGIGYNLIAEAITARRPELSVIPADTLIGTSMELTVLAGLPTVAFRNLNEGVAKSKPRFETRTFQCAILDQQVQVDKRLADLAKDRGRFLENQTMPVIEAALNHVSSQFYYGVTIDAKGFIGLIAQANSAATHVHDATGASAKSSVWFLSLGREKLEWLWGNNETVTLDGEWKEETLYDANGNGFPGLSNWVKGRPGLRLANKNAAVRIKNLSTGAGKTLTDAMMFAALRLTMDLGVDPTVIVMNGRSADQLRASRTATNVTGAPAPLPRDFEGIPIHISTSITNDESI